MIDTDKYEGHTEGPWRVDKTSGIVTEAGMPVTALTNQRFQTMTLMADAPLLLAEVKRLREELIELQGEHRLLGWKCATAVDWAEEIGFYWCEECRSAQHEWCEYHDECEHCKENKHHCGCAESMESDEVWCSNCKSLVDASSDHQCESEEE